MSVSVDLHCTACRYDEVLEVYRRNLYSLRRLILTGDSQQRNRVMHMFIQQWVDQLVAALIDPAVGPAGWTRESLDTARALAANLGSISSSKDRLTGKDSSPDSSRDGSQQQQQISPLAALMWHIHRLVNPPELVNKLQVEFKTVANGVAYDSTAQMLLQLTQVAAADGSNGQPRTAHIPLNVSEVTVLSPEQVQDLAAYLMQGKDLPWPKPGFQVGLKTQLALAAHAKLFGTPAAAVYSSGEGNGGLGQVAGESSGAVYVAEESCLPKGVLAMQRPAVKGRHAAKVR